MPDWAPVPNLPSVQATVASAQPAHLSGVDHIDPDGFGRGFNSVMNIRKTLGTMELNKLINEATDDKGAIHWDRVNTLIKEDKNKDLPLVRPDFLKTIRDVQSNQADHATDLSNQISSLDMLKKKGIITNDQANSMAATLAQRQQAAGVPYAGGNAQAYIDAGRKTMWDQAGNMHLGDEQKNYYQNMNDQFKILTGKVGVTPDKSAEINSNLSQVPYTNPNTNEKEVATVQKHVHPNGQVTLQKIANENTALSNTANTFDQQRQDWAIHKAPEFNRNMLNLDAALDAFDKSKGRSTWDPDIAKFENIMGLMATYPQLALAMAHKDTAALKNVETTNAHIQATADALGGSINDPRLREYALYVMAKNYLLNAMEGMRMQNSNEKEYNAHNYGEVGGAPAVADLMIMHALKQRHPNVYKDIVNLNTFLNHNYENEYNNQRSIQQHAAQTDPYWNYRLGDIQNRLEIRKK